MQNPTALHTQKKKKDKNKQNQKQKTRTTDPITFSGLGERERRELSAAVTHEQGGRGDLRAAERTEVEGRSSCCCGNRGSARA